MSNLSQIKYVADNIRVNFEYIITELMHKSMKQANKQLQDTLMNYFLENFVSPIIRIRMNLNYNRAVRNQLSSNLQPFFPKYISLLNNYEDKIKELNCGAEYENLLKDIFTNQSNFEKGSEKWQTHTRKQMLCILIYVHWLYPDRRDELCNFYFIWNAIFPSNPLPYKNRWPKSKTQSNIQQIEEKDITKSSDEKIFENSASYEVPSSSPEPHDFNGISKTKKRKSKELDSYDTQPKINISKQNLDQNQSKKQRKILKNKFSKEVNLTKNQSVNLEKKDISLHQTQPKQTSNKVTDTNTTSTCQTPEVSNSNSQQTYFHLIADKTDSDHSDDEDIFFPSDNISDLIQKKTKLNSSQEIILQTDQSSYEIDTVATSGSNQHLSDFITTEEQINQAFFKNFQKLLTEPNTFNNSISEMIINYTQSYQKFDYFSDPLIENYNFNQ